MKFTGKLKLDGHDLAEIEQAASHLNILVNKMYHKYHFCDYVETEDDEEYVGPDFDTEVELTSEEIRSLMIAYICLQEAFGVTFGQRIVRTVYKGEDEDE